MRRNGANKQAGGWFRKQHHRPLKQEDKSAYVCTCSSQPHPAAQAQERNKGNAGFKNGGYQAPRGGGNELLLNSYKVSGLQNEEFWKFALQQCECSYQHF